jgi:DNA-binding NarL/FixJ family response regulator
MPRRTSEDEGASRMAVLQLLKRGETNKIIANELGMSESTVEEHVRNILEEIKMRATNRTGAVEP